MLGRRTAAGLARRLAAAACSQQLGIGSSALPLQPQTWTAAAVSHADPWRRPFSSSGAAAAKLGIVEQLRDSSSPTVEAAAAAREQSWAVVEFRADGSVAEVDVSPHDLALHPRDIYLFGTDEASAGAQGAVLAPRKHAFLFCTDALRAMVQADRAVLWPERRQSETVRVAQIIKDFVEAQTAYPFEMRVLEALLSETVRSHAVGARRLAVVAEAVLQELQAGGGNTSTGELQRLIPIERQLNHMLNEVQDLVSTIGDVGNSEAYTRMLCLSQRAAAAAGGSASGQGSAGEGADDSALASAILKAYEAKLHNTQLVLREALGGIEQMRASWHMALDHQRNRVLRVDLFVGVVSLCAVLSSMPAAYLGMNLLSGMEETPGLFWPVIQCSLAGGVTLAGSLYAYYRFGPRWRYARRMRDIDGLRDLIVYHLNDLGDVMAAAKRSLRAASAPSMSRAEFAELVAATVSSKQPMTAQEVDLLYRVLDADNDGLLELSDMERLEGRISSELGER